MTVEYFEYLGKKSSDFGLLIDADISFASPQVKGEYVDVAGTDGELFVGDGKLSNVKKSFPVFLENPRTQTVATDVSNWLKSSLKTWNPLYFSGDPNYMYEAIYTDEYDIDANVESYGKTVLTFTVKPTKFLKSGLTAITAPSNLTNPTQRDAKPIIIIKGTGNITLKIGAETLTLKSVDGGVVIDCLKQTVTNLTGTAPAWDKVTSYPLPVIKPGKQTVLTTGTITELKITPRYEVIV